MTTAFPYAFLKRKRTAVFVMTLTWSARFSLRCFIGVDLLLRSRWTFFWMLPGAEELFVFVAAKQHDVI